MYSNKSDGFSAMTFARRKLHRYKSELITEKLPRLWATEFAKYVLVLFTCECAILLEILCIVRWTRRTNGAHPHTCRCLPQYYEYNTWLQMRTTTRTIAYVLLVNEYNIIVPNTFLWKDSYQTALFLLLKSPRIDPRFGTKKNLRSKGSVPAVRLNNII